MKKLTFILLFLLLAFAVSASAKKQVENPLVYDQDVVYQGQFKATQVYVRYDTNRFWYPSKRFESTRQIRCEEASLGIQGGLWIGNISDEGQCEDPGEAPEWATGNYLNFLLEKSRALNPLPQK